MPTRPTNPMPDFVKNALAKDGLTEVYDARPRYQRNDYLGWIARAKRSETVEKRLNQLLDELRKGDVYMKMVYRPRK